MPPAVRLKSACASSSGTASKKSVGNVAQTPVDIDDGDYESQDTPRAEATAASAMPAEKEAKQNAAAAPAPAATNPAWHDSPEFKHDPGAALRRAEKFAARKAALKKIEAEAAEAKAQARSERMRQRNTPRSSAGGCSASSLQSSMPAFGATSSSTSAFGRSRTERFKAAPTERSQTSPYAGPAPTSKRIGP